MIGKWLNYMARLHDGVDAILIADRHGIIEYSAMFSERENGMIDEGFIGKSILEAYPELTEETSSHFRVMRTGKPVLNEKQELTDFYGRRIMLVSSTFPLEDGGELIGTMETSVFYHKDSQLDGKNHWLTNSHTGLFRLEDIITRNSEMLALKDTVQRVAANPSPVLIWGETGTGKELFAQALHSHSTRSKGPFISQNCAAIPTTLLESTLFGTTRGSYTGAEN
ncbi:MAG TPA: sigma 54-interacting transcriptional regulator, partial [Candidatus Acutalibacter pullicola]|nr:sigma 54-interacting transcriptional regulator [Candidatus Acutalibacter pullicola]